MQAGLLLGAVADDSALAMLLGVIYVYVYLLDKHRNDISKSKKLQLITSRRDDNNMATFFIDTARPRAYYIYIVSSLPLPAAVMCVLYITYIRQSLF